VTFEYCDYIFDPGNAPGVTVAVADLGSSGVSFFDQFRQSKAPCADVHGGGCRLDRGRRWEAR